MAEVAAPRRASYGSTAVVAIGWYATRRTSSPYTPTRARARAFGATTDTLLTTALALNLALPAAGMLLALLLRDPYWKRHFSWSLAGTALIYMVVAVAASAATAPLIGWTPEDHQPAPPVTHCIPVSGGHGCPGG